MSFLKKANQLFKEKRYTEAKENYKSAIKQNKNIEEFVSFNLTLCEKKMANEDVFEKEKCQDAPDENVSGTFIRERDMHGKEISLSPKPWYLEPGYRLDREKKGSYVYLPYGEKTKNKKQEFTYGIHIHIFYQDLIEEFAKFLENIPFAFHVYVSVVDSKIKPLVQKEFRRLSKAEKIEVKVFSNRGRDISHFVAGFSKELLGHDIIGHFHSKRSPHNFMKGDWRRQLLVPLLGSPETIEKIADIFAESPNIGMIFPVYHYSLRGQISWGTNFGVSKEVAHKLGLDIDENSMALFPAGSMFWARSAALKNLLEVGFGYESFPEEQAQVDGTLAHAIERLFGSIVINNGFDLLQVDTEKQYSLIKYFPAKYPYFEKKGFLEKVEDYCKKKKKRNKIVVFTALSGGYEELPRPQYLNPDYDYVAFCDQPIDSQGIWEVRPMDFWHPDKVRMARRIKTNPHVYLKEYEMAIWIDANVVIEADITSYVEEFKSSSACLGGIPHPIRNCVYHEAKSIIEAKKDAGYRVDRQIQEYRKEQYPEYNGLIETNLMFLKLNLPETERLLNRWWSEICKYSHRDQLSINYALWKEGLDWHVIMKDRVSLRDNFDFAYMGHGRNSGFVRGDQKLAASAVKDPVDFLKAVNSKKARRDNSKAVDIIVCVHNALDEVRACLRSVSQSRRGADRLIIIDDCSGEETREYLQYFSDNHTWVTLHRNTGEAQGYCRAANKGMELTKREFFILLNSDTLITRNAIENMLVVASENEKVGIVGPMSNAASTQSLPDIKNSSGQTAINILPESIGVQEMNTLCEKWSYDGLYPSVPLVHGFCQLIRRSVYKTIGGFDEKAFPEGYGEENDFCLRAVDAGYDLKVSTNSFVFHKKSASYSDSERRVRLMKAGNEQLKRKHGEDRLVQSIKIMEGHYLLERMRKQANSFFVNGLD